MDTAKVFTSGRSQAVRLPKAYRFNEDEVFIRKIGEVVVLLPRDSGWDVLAEAIGHFTDDYLASRGQPAEAEERTRL